MTTNIHPTSSELATAVTEPGKAGPVLAHVEDCLACRVFLSRVRQDLQHQPPDEDSVQRILAASTPLPEGLGELIRAPRQGDPLPDEVWRIGRDEALLIWVRHVFDDGVADVVPLVLDTELADQESVLVDADETQLAMELAAMVALRTHIDLGAFLNRIGRLDIRQEVDEVITASREGRRPSGVRVGPPIDDDSDQRIEYRQALRDLLSEFTPSAWGTDESETPSGTGARQALADKHPDGLEDIKSQLGERMNGLKFSDVEGQFVILDGGARLSTALKVHCLNTAILVVTADVDPSDETAVAAACEKMVAQENDADAVAVAIPTEAWTTSLFVRADLRTAIELPGGAPAGPRVTLGGHSLVDILAKYLEDAVSPWEVTEPVSGRLPPSNDLRQIVLGHAEVEIGRVSQEGQRAHQAAKKAAWQSIPSDLGEQVARFVDAVVSDTPVDEALTEIDLGDSR